MTIHIAGYEHFTADRRNVIAKTTLVPQLREVLSTGTLYDYARTVPNARVLHGRAPVYVIPFGPAGEGQVAVRHAMRGGFMARLLTDRFLPPTRAPHELLTSLQLQLTGVPTPPVVAIVTYPAGGPFRRADVMTQYIEDGADLAAILGDSRNNAQRLPILETVAQLIIRLTMAGVIHPDLNLKNIVITSETHGYHAHVLDVDRVLFHPPGDPTLTHVNLNRLVRSLRKWRSADSARQELLTDRDIAHLSQAALSPGTA